MELFFIKVGENNCIILVFRGLILEETVKISL